MPQFPMTDTPQDPSRYGTLAIAQARLERFENRTRHRDYTIRFACPEFTCLCPRSGFPDFATLHIEYQPLAWCVELKSLKLWLNGFRNTGIFHEDVANRVCDELRDLLEPRYLKVLADFTVRGNIHTTVTAIHGEPNRGAL